MMLALLCTQVMGKISKFSGNWDGNILRASDNSLQDLKVEAAFDEGYLFVNATTNGRRRKFKLTEEGDQIHVLGKSDKLLVKLDQKDQLFSGATESVRVVAGLFNGLLTISLTDPFESNATLITLQADTGIEKMKSVILGMVLIVMVVGTMIVIYKSGDLKDIITPEEGKLAQDVKRQAMASDKKKQKKPKGGKKLKNE